LPKHKEWIWKLSEWHLAESNGALQVETSKAHEFHLHELLVGVQGCAQVGEYVWQLEETSAIEKVDLPKWHQWTIVWNLCTFNWK
jgi:hypothetical protein